MTFGSQLKQIHAQLRIAMTFAFREEPSLSVLVMRNARLAAARRSRVDNAAGESNAMAILPMEQPIVFLLITLINLCVAYMTGYRAPGWTGALQEKDGIGLMIRLRVLSDLICKVAALQDLQ